MRKSLCSALLLMSLSAPASAAEGPDDGYLLMPAGSWTMFEPGFPVASLAMGGGDHIAHLHPLGENRFALVASHPGRTCKLLLARDGRRATPCFEVFRARLGSSARPAPEPSTAKVVPAWLQPEFGGGRIEAASCEPSPSRSATATLLAHGRALDAKGRPSEAIELFEAALLMPPSVHARTLLRLGSALSAVGDFQRAAEAFESFVLTCPEDPASGPLREVLRRYQTELARQARPAASAPKPRTDTMTADRCMVPALAPTQVLLEMGRALRRDQHRAEAIDHFAAARALEPESAITALRLGESLLDTDPAAAAELLADYLASCPEAPAAQRARALLGSAGGQRPPGD